MNLLRNTPAARRGLTLIEILIALFVLLIGVMGILAAMPTGIDSAQKVVFLDASVHLSRSKFAEFRRDRIDPRVDLLDGSGYMDAALAPPRGQEQKNGNAGGWRDFAHGAGETYEYFDDIERYQWLVDQGELRSVGLDSNATPAAPNTSPYVPVVNAGADVGLTRVTIVINLKGTKKEQRYTQYMYSYGN
ncbi:MAG: prepilin-type N-terminal cleavage/methylation domain-containing protein [Planctomycetota bacterium]|nr:prepilin-type N-terminal cleavage/methylation domain-containing protein [Planctomycetota bacterium]